MFRGQLSLQRRSKKRSPVVDGYVRSSSPILGFHSPLRGRRGMMHAKSCDITPTRLKLLELEADRESQSSDESWNVNLDQENTSCQVCFLTHYSISIVLLMHYLHFPTLPMACNTR